MQAPVVEAVADAAEVPLAVHVTSPASWAAIQADGCLRRMNRCSQDSVTPGRWVNCCHPRLEA